MEKNLELTNSEYVRAVVTDLIAARINYELGLINAYLPENSTDAEIEELAPFKTFCFKLAAFNVIGLLSKNGHDDLENIYISKKELLAVLHELAVIFWLRIIDRFETIENYTSYVIGLPTKLFLNLKTLSENHHTALQRIIKEEDFNKTTRNYDGVYLFCYTIAIFCPVIKDFIDLEN